MMRDTWTTFSKARLNCSLPGEFPFYYDEIQGAAYHPDEGIIYATFTTPRQVHESSSSFIIHAMRFNLCHVFFSIS